MIVKSRQIGATWYFARERLLVALETGKNQIFLSASRAQANIFRAYIVQWVQKVCGVMLKGDPIVIQRGEGRTAPRSTRSSCTFWAPTTAPRRAITATW
jgi:uncharacterized protein YjcR